MTPAFSRGMVLYEFAALKRPFEEERGHPQSYISEGKRPLWEKSYSTNNNGRILQALYQRCVSVKREERPALIELRKCFLKMVRSEEEKEN